MIGRTSGWAAVILAGVLSTAAAQTTQPSAADILTVPYVEPAFGFEMRLPGDWEYDRSRFQQFKDAIGLLRGRGAGGRQALQVQVFRVQPLVTTATETQPATVHLPSFEDWVVDFGKALGELANVERVDWETWMLPPRAGAVLSYDSKVGATRTRTFTLCVPFDASTVWVLAFTGSLDDAADPKQLRALFDALAGSLKIHYDPGTVELQAAAFDRGRVLLERLHAQAARVPFDETEYHYEISLTGQAIGYLRRRASREDHDFSSAGAKIRDVRAGLRVRERSWRFADDGTVRHTRLDLFSSFDGQNELAEYEQVQLPAPDVQPQRPLIKTDRVIRKADVLFSSFTTSLDASLPDPGKPHSVGPVYLDLAWLRLVPGLLLSAPPEPHAFVVYDTEVRALSSQTFTALGVRELPGFSGTAYAFEVREGLLDQPVLLYADERGNLLRLVAGDLVISRTTREDVERRFAARRDAACQRFGLRPD